MTSSNTPTTPGTPAPTSNVTPMPWLAQGNMWPGRPPAVPPNCFSQLYGLNQCYDDIQAMKYILTKVICDLASTSPEFQQCLAAAVSAAGAGSPLMGVTNGVAAAPGVVGEFVQTIVRGNYAAGATQNMINMGVIQPGDWYMGGVFAVGGAINSINGYLNPVPAGMSTNMGFYNGLAIAPPSSGGEEALWNLQPGQLLISVPTLMVFEVDIAATVGANYTLILQALRTR